MSKHLIRRLKPVGFVKEIGFCGEVEASNRMASATKEDVFKPAVESPKVR